MSDIPELKLSRELILNRSVVIYGESKCGKTKLILDCLCQIKDHVGQIFVVSPMDRQNAIYSSGYAPLPAILYSLSVNWLKTTWERQEAFVAVYGIANKMETLESLFRRIATPQLIEQVNSINSGFDKYCSEIRATHPEAQAAEIITKSCEKKDDLIRAFYKRHIEQNSARLKQMQLDKNEQLALRHLRLNPNIVIVFDDCTDILMRLRSNEYMLKMFNQGRHNRITLIIAGHSLKCLLEEQRTAAFMSIFGGPKILVKYYKECKDDTKERAMAAMPHVFTKAARWQKLVYVREEDTFYRYTAELHMPFRVGSDEFWEYCQKISVTGNDIPSNNRFLIDMMN